VFGADFDGRKEPQKGSALSGRFDGRSAVGFFAFDDADDGGDDHTGFTRGFNGVDG